MYKKNIKNPLHQYSNPHFGGGAPAPQPHSGTRDKGADKPRLYLFYMIATGSLIPANTR